MAVATWPTSLPQKPRPQDFEWIFPDVVEIFKPDVGPVKTRGKATVGEGQLVCTFDMDETQVITFEIFWTGNLSFGLKNFDCAHPFTDITHEWFIKGVPVIRNKGGEEYIVTLNMLYGHT